MKPFTDIYFSVTPDGDSTRFFKGVNEIDQAAWEASSDPRGWWI